MLKGMHGAFLLPAEDIDLYLHRAAAHTYSLLRPDEHRAVVSGPKT
jgi:hypothetical protein